MMWEILVHDMTDSMEVASDDNAEDTSVGDLVFADDVIAAGEELNSSTSNAENANATNRRTSVGVGAVQVNIWNMIWSEK